MPLFGIQLFLSEADVAQYTVINIYAVLIATPEAVLALIGSRILNAVYISMLAMQRHRMIYELG